jgi:SAM-dependent methyltransferase
MTIEFINNILFWICLFVLLWNAYFLLFNQGIPNIKTAKAIREKIIAELKKEIAQSGKENFTILDLGSGNGTLTRHIAKEIPKANVIGLEINKIAYWHSLFFKKIQNIKNLSYRNVDLYKTNISEADAVVMFLLGSFMKDIREKLEQDLKKGAFVFSNKFKINGDWEPLETFDIKTLAPNQKTFYKYQR